MCAHELDFRDHFSSGAWDVVLMVNKIVGIKCDVAPGSLLTVPANLGYWAQAVISGYSQEIPTKTKIWRYDNAPAAQCTGMGIQRAEGEWRVETGDRNQIIGSSAVTVCPWHQQPIRGILCILVTNERPGNQTSSLRLWPAKTNIALNREIVLLRLTKIESSAHLLSTQISGKNTRAAWAARGEQHFSFLLRIVRWESLLLLTRSPLSSIALTQFPGLWLVRWSAYWPLIGQSGWLSLISVL